MMSKKNIIFICIAAATVIVVAFVIWLTITIKNNETNTEKLMLIQYNDNLDIKKTIEITNKKEIEELKNIYNNVSLEQDEKTSYIAIKNDVKLELNNGNFLIIQLDLEEYCYYENLETNTKLVIKMPNGLLEKVNEILIKNS